MISQIEAEKTISGFWTADLCQLQIYTGDYYTTWLSELSLYATCMYYKEESVCICMHEMNVLTASTYPHSPVSSQINTNFFLFLLFFSPLYKS